MSQLIHFFSLDVLHDRIGYIIIWSFISGNWRAHRRCTWSRSIQADNCWEYTGWQLLCNFEQRGSGKLVWLPLKHEADKYCYWYHLLMLDFLTGSPAYIHWRPRRALHSSPSPTRCRNSEPRQWGNCFWYDCERLDSLLWIRHHCNWALCHWERFQTKRSPAKLYRWWDEEVTHRQLCLGFWDYISSKVTACIYITRCALPMCWHSLNYSFHWTLSHYFLTLLDNSCYGSFNSSFHFLHLLPLTSDKQASGVFNRKANPKAG